MPSKQTTINKQQTNQHTTLAASIFAKMPVVTFGAVYHKFLTSDMHSAWGCASQIPCEARSSVGTHLSKFWPYPGNWAKRRGWALFHEWALFRKTTVYTNPIRSHHFSLVVMKLWMYCSHLCPYFPLSLIPMSQLVNGNMCIKVHHHWSFMWDIGHIWLPSYMKRKLRWTETAWLRWLHL